MDKQVNQGVAGCVGMAIGAAVGGFMGKGAGACFGAALGQGFGSLLRESALDAVAKAEGEATASVVAHIIQDVLEQRSKCGASRRPPIMGGRLASKCLAAASQVFGAEDAESTDVILRFWAEGLEAAAKSPQAYLVVFDMAAQWDELGDAWGRALMTRLWSPARMESLFLGDLIEFLMCLPEDPDACGMSWSVLQVKKSQTTRARAVPTERRRLLLERKREVLASELRTSFMQAVTDDPAAMDELGSCLELFASFAESRT